MGERLQDKVSIITGSGRGIGRACALRFADEGAIVVVNDVDEQSADRTVEAIRQAGGRAVQHVADVTDSREVDGLVERAMAEYGRLDVMFNNAGGALPQDTAAMTDPDFRDLVSLNLDGVFYGTRAALRVMVPRERGCILMTASGAGLGAVPGLAAYGMAKAGVIQLARSVAAEYGPRGIRANVIAPGPIRSEGMATFLDSVDGLEQRMESDVPLRRLGRPEDIADTAAFLASDEASYVSGAVIPVDGGISARYPSPSLGPED